MSKKLCILGTGILIFIGGLIPGNGTAQTTTESYEAVRLPFWLEVAWEQFRSALEVENHEAAENVFAEVAGRGKAEGILRFDPFSAVLIHEGRKLLADGEYEKGIMRGNYAVKWSPGYPNASFFLAYAHFKNSPINIIAPIRYWFKGIGAVAGNFWHTYYLVGHGLLIVSAGLLGAFTLINVFILFRSLSLITHSFLEWGVINMHGRWGILALIIILPLVTGWGVGIGLLFLMALSWHYANKRERVMQALFILSMGSALLWLPFAFSLFTAGLSGDIRLLAHSIEGQAGSPRISTVLNPENEGVKDFDVLISKAVIEQRLESYENALGFYVLAQRLQPDKPLIDINRGNILFTTKKFDPAINSYREALKKNPASFLPHYNLNIVYTDLFRFDEAKLSLEEAQNINLPLTQELTERTTGVVYQVPEKRILWKKVFAPSEYKTEQAVQLFGMLFKPAGLPQSPVIIAVFAAAIGIFRLVFNNRYISQPCGLCQKAICFHCQRRLFDLRVCRACWTNSRNIKRKADLRQLKSHRKKLRKFSGIASLILPGTGHFLYEKPFRALFILSLFLGLVFILFFPKWLLQPPGSSGGFSGIWLSPLVLASLIILYLLTWKDLNRLQV